GRVSSARPALPRRPSPMTVTIPTKAFWFVGGVLAALLGVWLWPAASARPGTTEAAAEQPQPPPKFWRPTPADVPKDGKLRVIAFGAHPDDCALKAAGCAAKSA